MKQIKFISHFEKVLYTNYPEEEIAKLCQEKGVKVNKNFFLFFFFLKIFLFYFFKFYFFSQAPFGIRRKCCDGRGKQKYDK